MKKILLILLVAVLTGCPSNTTRKEIETRREALKQKQETELKKSQEELAIVDSTLEAVKREYEVMKVEVEKHKQQLCATADELTLLTKTRVRRDSLQTRFDVLCAKIRYIHKKQKEL